MFYSKSTKVSNEVSDSELNQQVTRKWLQTKHQSNILCSKHGQGLQQPRPRVQAAAWFEKQSQLSEVKLREVQSSKAQSQESCAAVWPWASYQLARLRISAARQRGQDLWTWDYLRKSVINQEDGLFGRKTENLDSLRLSNGHINTRGWEGSLERQVLTFEKWTLSILKTWVLSEVFNSERRKKRTTLKGGEKEEKEGKRRRRRRSEFNAIQRYRGRRH